MMGTRLFVFLKDEKRGISEVGDAPFFYLKVSDTRSAIRYLH